MILHSQWRSWRELSLWTSLICASAFLFAGCENFETMSPADAKTRYGAKICGGDPDCRPFIVLQLTCWIYKAFYDWETCTCKDTSRPETCLKTGNNVSSAIARHRGLEQTACSLESAAPRARLTDFGPTPRAPSLPIPAINFVTAASLPTVAFNGDGSAAYTLVGFRQADGSYTAQSFSRTDTATTYIGSVPGLQDVFAEASGVSPRTPAPHPTLLADMLGVSSMQLVATRLGGTAPYSIVSTGTINTINVSLDSANTLWQSQTTYGVGINDGSDPAALLVADFNGDGKRDVAVLNNGDPSSVSILLGNGDGTLRQPVVYNNVGQGPLAMTAYDFNHDGRPDLAIPATTNDPYTNVVTVLLANADGSMRLGGTYNIPAASGASTSIVAADFDGDGQADLMVYTRGTGLTLLHGKGDGTFQVMSPKTGYSPSTAVVYLAAGDFNKDGKTDLAMLNSDGTVTILLNAGDGSFPTQKRYVVGTQMASGFYLFTMQGTMFATDFNDDGNLDLVFASGHPDALYPGLGFTTVLFGKGDGSFQGAPVYGVARDPRALAVADFNGDGHPDLVAAGHYSDSLKASAVVLLGQSGGGFQAAVPLSTGYPWLNWVGTADLNGDGKMDVIGASDKNSALTVFAWLGKGDGTFQAPVTYSVSNDYGDASVAIGDLNGDGRPDLIVARGNQDAPPYAADSVYVMLAKAGGGFNPATTLKTGTNTVQMTLADVNGDGKLDLVTANFGYAGSTPAAGSVSVLLGKGDGTFQAPITYTVAQNPQSVAVVDVNRDGKLDLIVGTTTGTDSEIAVLLGNGNGTFGTPTLFGTYSRVSKLLAVDLDADSKLDLVLIHTPGDRPFTTMRGNGDGTFQAESSWMAGYSPMAAVAADFYADQKPALAVLGQTDSIVGSSIAANGFVSVLRNVSTGIAPPANSTVTTNPAGLSIVVDGNTLTAPQTFTWNPGESHTLGVASPQTGAGARYNFASWSDGGAQTHTISAPSEDTAYIASFTAAQYLLTKSASPAAGGTVSASPPSSDGYYAPGTSVQLTATAATAAGYTFAGWSGDLSGSTNPQSIIMSAPHTVTALFSGGPAVTGLRFIPVTPCRVADTRNATGDFGGPSIGAAGTRSFVIPSSSCGIPSTAAAYSLNVTVVPQAALGYLSIWPTGSTQPYVSTLNSLDGRIKANAAIVPAGTNGAISVYVTDKTDVVLDINGYFTSTSDSSALAFYTATPCRIADTRNAAGAFGGPSMSGGATRTFAIPQSSCNIPATARAYSLNFTAVPKGPLGYLTTWPAGGTQPYVSTLNSPLGVVVANAAIVPAGTANQAISVYVTEATDVVIDINGYFAPPGSGTSYSFYAVNPCRISDTRNATGTFGGPIMGASTSRTYPIPTSACGLPSTATGYSLNVTVVPSGGLGYLTLWPAGGAQPYVSTLNAFDGSITANAALVPAGTSGGVNVFVLNDTHVILDVNGYFAP